MGNVLIRGGPCSKLRTLTNSPVMALKASLLTKSWWSFTSSQSVDVQYCQSDYPFPLSTSPCSCCCCCLPLSRCRGEDSICRPTPLPIPGGHSFWENNESGDGHGNQGLSYSPTMTASILGSSSSTPFFGFVSTRQPERHQMVYASFREARIKSTSLLTQ